MPKEKPAQGTGGLIIPEDMELYFFSSFVNADTLNDRLHEGDPGPGYLVIYQTTGTWDIPGDGAAEISFVSASTADPYAYASWIERRPGIILWSATHWATWNGIIQMSLAHASPWWSNSEGFETVSSSTDRIYAKHGDGSPSPPIGHYTSLANTTWFAIVTESDGSYFFAKFSPDYPVWTLLHKSFQDTLRNEIIPFYATYDANVDLEQFGAGQLGSPFDVDYGYASFYDGAPTPVEGYHNTPDFIAEGIITTVTEAGGYMRIYFRRDEATGRCWIVEISPTAIKLIDDTVSWTEVASYTTIAPANADRILVKAQGARIQVYKNHERVINYSTATNHQTKTYALVPSGGINGAWFYWAAYPMYPSGEALAQLEKFTGLA